MTDAQRKHGHSAVITALPLVLPILYVLSIGPAARLEVREWLPSGTVQTIYLPLQALYEHSPPSVQEAMKWYVERWAD